MSLTAGNFIELDRSCGNETRRWCHRHLKPPAAALMKSAAGIALRTRCLPARSAASRAVIIRPSPAVCRARPESDDGAGTFFNR